jgi:large subunit ribosomal protein L33
MGKSKKKAETVFLVCEETGDHNYTLKRRKAETEKVQPPAAQAHAARGEEEVA